jgi:hypothetical protein
VCRQCGHQFRTSAESLPPEKSLAPDPLHRTMQFTLPPLKQQVAPAAEPVLETADSKRRSHFTRLFLMLGTVLVCCLLLVLWNAYSGSKSAAASPVGVWETTLHGKAAANAHLEFAFQSGGAGRFSWRESGSEALSGQTPLRWNQDANGRLALALVPPGGGDSVSQELAGIFSSHAWVWHVDRPQRRLVLGTLVFTEKP